jgi:hypothetical protein
LRGDLRESERHRQTRPCRRRVNTAAVDTSGPGWTGCNASRGPRALEGEMHGSPPHPAGSERDEPVPGMICGGAPPPQAPPEMHDPALAAGRTWSPRRETARLAVFRPLAFPAGPWPAIRPPVLQHLAPGPVARPDRPSVRRRSADSTSDGCRGGTAASSRPAPVGQARTARHQPPACEGITRQIAPSGRQPQGKSGHPGPGPPRPPAPQPPARRPP